MFQQTVQNVLFGWYSQPIVGKQSQKIKFQPSMLFLKFYDIWFEWKITLQHSDKLEVTEVM